MKLWAVMLSVCLGVGAALAVDRASVRREIEKALGDKNCSHARLLATRLLKSAADEAEAASLYLDLALVAQCDGYPCEEKAAYDRWLGWAAGRDAVDRSLLQYIGRQRDAAADRCPESVVPAPGETKKPIFEGGLTGAMGALDTDDGWQRRQLGLALGARVGDGTWRAELELGALVESADTGLMRLGTAWSPRGGPLFVRAGATWALGAVSGPGATVGVGANVPVVDGWRLSLAADATWWLVPALWPITGQIGVWHAL